MLEIVDAEEYAFPMEKIKVQGSYLNLEQTAKIFGLPREDVELVRRIANDVRVAQGREPLPPVRKAKRAIAKSNKAA